MASPVYLTTIIDQSFDIRLRNSSQNTQRTTIANQRSTRSTVHPSIHPSNVLNPHPPLSLLRPHLVSCPHKPPATHKNSHQPNKPPPQDRALPSLQGTPQPPNMPRLLRLPTTRPSELPSPPQPAMLHSPMGLSALRRQRTGFALQASLQIPRGGD